MRKDIYVVQKNEQEGIELIKWCKEQGLPTALNYFKWQNDNKWINVGYYKSIDNFVNNFDEVHSTKVTIEEFKRLQLESLGKTEELKIGDWVLIKLDQFDSLGEGGKFNDKKGVPLRIEEISNRCICKLSGIHCILSFDRFEKCEKPSSDLKSEFIVGKWYKILDNWWAKFKTVHNSGNRWQFSEHIDKNGAYSNIIQSIDVISEIKLLTDLSEIQEYLPLNHSDLIVKNICPEYVEYIDTKYKGQIVRVTEWSSANYCKIHHPIDGILKPFKDLVKPSTQEAFNKQIQTNDKWLIEQAKILYPINIKIYQLYSGGTSNKSHEITIRNHDFTIDSDGEVLYNGQYRLYTPINDTWATKVEEQPKYEVVHCKTQEQWDFVCETLNIILTICEWRLFKENSCINLENKKAGSLDSYQRLNAKIYTFEEWCNNNGYNFESIKKSVEGHFYIKLKNQKELNEIIKYFENKGYINSNQKTVFGDKYFIVYPEYRKFQLLALDCGYPEKQWVFESSNESLVGRWVKTKEGKYLLLTKSEDNGGYYVNYTSDFIDLHYVNRPTELKHGYELMSNGFIPTTILEKPSLDFNQLNIEDWLRETKKLNLSLEELDKHISSGATCHFDNVYSWLNGIGSLEKAEILWNEWNKARIDKTDFIVSIPDEWGQNKYVIGIDPYKLLEEEFKPNTQATLIPVKQKQIFKN